MNYVEFISEEITVERIVKACQAFRLAEEKDIKLAEYLQEIAYKTPGFSENKVVKQNYKVHVKPALVKHRVDNGHYDAEAESTKFMLECNIQDSEESDDIQFRDKLRAESYKLIKFLPNEVKQKYGLWELYSKLKELAGKSNQAA